MCLGNSWDLAIHLSKTENQNAYYQMKRAISDYYCLVHWLYWKFVSNNADGKLDSGAYGNAPKERLRR
jgi:hypothetical protein